MDVYVTNSRPFLVRLFWNAGSCVCYSTFAPKLAAVLMPVGIILWTDKKKSSTFQRSLFPKVKHGSDAVYRCIEANRKEVREFI